MIDRDEVRAAYAIADRSRARVRMNFVSSVDGAATVSGRSAGLGGESDREIMQVLRAMCDVILVGAGTVRAEGYGGTKVEGADARWRREADLAPQPRIAVVSRSLHIEPRHPVFADSVARPLVITCAQAPARRARELSEVSDVVACGDDDVDLAAALTELTRRGMPQILCEGGPRLFGALHDAGLVDEVCLTLAPRLAGGDAGRIMRGAHEAVSGLTLGALVRDGDWLFLRYVSH